MPRTHHKTTNKTCSYSQSLCCLYCTFFVLYSYLTFLCFFFTCCSMHCILSGGSTTHAAEKGRLVLNAANFLENERIDSQHDYRVRNAVHIVGSWLEELRDSHPQYRRYARSMNIQSLTYYSRAESSSSSSMESPSTSESD